ncbi:MAG: AraC family transcriptional regulator [Oscillospiraceae bacterium]|nr:AraC family transcriptional regulator [Oscillospiraceae bacterium]
MTINKMAEKLGLERLSGETDRDVEYCYISDLLSRVLGGCQPGDVWITVQSSLNMVAVAVMTDASCVILPEGLTAPDNVIDKANEEDLSIFTSDETAFSLAVRISELIRQK